MIVMGDTWIYVDANRSFQLVPNRSMPLNSSMSDPTRDMYFIVIMILLEFEILMMECS